MKCKNTILAAVLILLQFCWCSLWTILAVPSARAAPDYWDPRLNDICDLALSDVASQVPDGQYYWRLVETRFENEVEAGGKHHIFYKCLDSNGAPIEGQKFFQSWPYGNTAIDESQCVTGNWACDYTKGPGIDDYWGNIAMYGNCPPDGCQWPYNAFVSETTSPYVGLSDKVIGMGLTNPEPGGTPCNAHVCFCLIWRWTLKEGPSAVPGDFDGGGDVDMTDFAIFGAAWESELGDSNWNEICDISDPKDNVIDMLDLAVFVENWLVGVE